jgi:hypothetical protein
MLKRITERNWWLAGAVVVLLIVRLFQPFKSNVPLALIAALVIAVVTIVLMAIIPKSSH